MSREGNGEVQSNYKEIKNLFHNELGITREEVRKAIDDVILEVIVQEVNRYLKQQSIETVINATVRNYVNRAIINLRVPGAQSVENTVRYLIANEVKKRVEDSIVVNLDIVKRENEELEG